MLTDPVQLVAPHDVHDADDPGLVASEAHRQLGLTLLSHAKHGAKLAFAVDKINGLKIQPVVIGNLRHLGGAHPLDGP